MPFESKLGDTSTSSEEIERNHELICSNFSESNDLRQPNSEEFTFISNISNVVEEDYGEGIMLLSQCEEFLLLRSMMSQLKDALAKESRTSKLWLLYLEYIGVVKKFIRSKRTGNYFSSVKDMLDLFAATGHFHYAKCGRLQL